ncbi:hypothetical protein [Hymenobacter glaciei]
MTVDKYYTDLIRRNLNNVPAFNELKNTLTQFQSLDFFIAGGAIRNLISNTTEQMKDVDLFVNTLSQKSNQFERLQNLLSKKGTLEFGQYGSPRWFPNQMTSFYYDIVPFHKFDVGFGNPTSIDETLLQFDFTANAVGFNIYTNVLHNPIRGLEDSENNILKAVRLDFPDEIISAQVPVPRLSVLWFRFMHYASKLDYVIEEETLLWIIQNSYRIKDLYLFEKYFFKPDIKEGLVSKL